MFIGVMDQKFSVLVETHLLICVLLKKSTLFDKKDDDFKLILQT